MQIVGAVVVGLLVLFGHGWPLFRGPNSSLGLRNSDHRITQYCDANASSECLWSARVAAIKVDGSDCLYTVVRTYREGGDAIPSEPSIIRQGCGIEVGAIVYVNNGSSMVTGEYPWGR